jgi:hypothetical protein
LNQSALLAHVQLELEDLATPPAASIEWIDHWQTLSK